MGKVVYGIPKDWLLALMRATQGFHTRVDAYIPKDAKIVGVEYEASQDVIKLVMESEKFTAQRDGFETLDQTYAWGE